MHLIHIFCPKRYFKKDSIILNIYFTNFSNPKKKYVGISIYIGMRKKLQIYDLLLCSIHCTDCVAVNSFSTYKTASVVI